MKIHEINCWWNRYKNPEEKGSQTREVLEKEKKKELVNLFDNWGVKVNSAINEYEQKKGKEKRVQIYKRLNSVK